MGRESDEGVPVSPRDTESLGARDALKRGAVGGGVAGTAHISLKKTEINVGLTNSLGRASRLDKLTYHHGNGMFEVLDLLLRPEKKTVVDKVIVLKRG